MTQASTETRTSTDRIEKNVMLQAPRSRVWRALTTASEFGEWFGMDMNGEFAPGAVLKGRITNEGYRGVPEFELRIERVEPEHTFSYRWHPHAIEHGVDYSVEPMTLVLFTLEDAGGGTRLTVVETGFDALPPERRDTAFRGNSGGWASQMERIRKHVDS
ncbi:MAG: vanillate O-demethylase oxidoreductase VanB [Gemmatimonadetes bacterium]|nr:vanillate O-demethylase oxidoreductase VanB [Gemmatimonadota bacterium]